MPFQYNTKHVDDYDVIEIVGDLKVFDLADYTAFFDDYLSDGHRNIIIDFSKINYIDSTAIGLLVNIKRNAEEVGGSLKISSVNDDIMNVFSITGIDHFMEIFPTVEDALKS
jgi:anti-sigma B factor antagonist